MLNLASSPFPFRLTWFYPSCLFSADIGCLHFFHFEAFRRTLSSLRCILYLASRPFNLKCLHVGHMPFSPSHTLTHSLCYLQHLLPGALQSLPMIPSGSPCHSASSQSFSYHSKNRRRTGKRVRKETEYTVPSGTLFGPLLYTHTHTYTQTKAYSSDLILKEG